MAQGTSIGSLFYSTGIDFSGFKRDAKQGQSAMSGLFNPAIIGTAALGAGLIKLGSDALKFSKEFETAFAEVQTISQSARENADEMSDAILKMTTEIPIGAIDGANALYQIVSAGFDGAEAMNVLEVSAKAAVAGVTTTAIAADTLTTIINAYGLEASEVTNISDALFKTVELGKTTLAEIGASFSNVASLAAAYGVNVNEALAATAAMTKQGAPTAQAMTAIRAAIISVTEKLGENIFQTMSFGDALQLARDEADKSGKGLKDYFGRVEAINGALMLTNQNAHVYIEALDDITKSSGSADKALEIMNTTLKSQETLLANNFKLLKKELGDQLSVLEKGFLPRLNSELKILSDSTIPGYAKALSVLANIATLGFGGFTAEGFSPEIVKSLLRSERAVEDFTNKTKSLSNEAFTNEIDNIKEQRDANLKSFKDLEDRKKKGFQFDADALEEAKDRNLIFYQILEKAELRLAQIREKSDKDPDKPKGGVVPVKITLGGLKKELKDLNDALETATKTEAIEIEVKIRTKEKELVDFVTDVNDRIRSINDKTDGGFTKGLSVGILDEGVSLSKKQIREQTEDLKKQTKNLKKINSSWVKQAKLVQKVKNEQDDADKSLEKTVDQLFQMADIMGSLAGLASLFDDELSDSIDNMANLAQGAADLAMGLSTGNIAQSVAGSVQILSTLFDNSAAKQFEADQAAKNLVQTIEQQNRKLERQIELLRTLQGVGRVQGEQAVLDEIEKQIDALNEEADAMELVLKKSKKGNALNLWRKTTQTIEQQISSVDDLIEKYIGLGDSASLTEELLSKGFTIKDEDRINEIIDKYDELLAKRRELFEGLTQTDTNSIADILTQGFAEGKDSMADFADDFESLMKNAMLESFKTQFLLNASKGFFDEFGELSKGGLTADEIKVLKDNFTNVISDAEAGFDLLNEVFKESFGGNIFDNANSAETGATGAIGRAITEDTATELQGIWNRSLFETISHTAILTESNGYLSEIAVNTRETADGINLLNDKISSDSNNRDTGLNL